MPKDTFSDTVLFPQCVEVLREELVPMHYKELTEKAVSRLHKIGMVTERPINMERQKEDVREKLLDARKLGTFYMSRPYCYGALKKWFVTVKSDKQLMLFSDPTRYVVVPVTITSAINGTYEALMRDAYMINKGGIPEKDRKLCRAYGLQIESAVLEMFQSRYPDFFVAPDNNQLWSVPCDHDFKLSVEGHLLKVDVSGKTPWGNFGNADKKAKTDIHLLCEVPKKQEVRIIGVVRGENYVNSTLKSSDIHNRVFSPDSFMVWLNIHKKIKNATYTQFIEAAGTQKGRTRQRPTSRMATPYQGSNQPSHATA